MYKSYVIISYAWIFYMNPEKPNQNQLDNSGSVRVGSKEKYVFFWKCGSLFASETQPKSVWVLWEPKYPKCLCKLYIFVYFGYFFAVHIFLSFGLNFRLQFWISSKKSNFKNIFGYSNKILSIFWFLGSDFKYNFKSFEYFLIFRYLFRFWIFFCVSSIFMFIEFYLSPKYLNGSIPVTYKKITYI